MLEKIEEASKVLALKVQEVYFRKHIDYLKSTDLNSLFRDSDEEDSPMTSVILSIYYTRYVEGWFNI